MQHGAAAVIHVAKTIEQVPRAPVSSAAATMTQQHVVAVALAGCITELQTLALCPSWQSLHHHLHLKSISYRLLQTSLLEQVPPAPVSSAAATMTQQNVVAVALAGCITELQTLALWPPWQSLHHHLHLKRLSYRLL
jgi:hypothetical protein